MKSAVCLVVATLLLSACSKSKPTGEAPKPSASPVSATATVAAVKHPAPPDGPTEEELFKALAAQYQRIRDAGGMPVTVTASGKSGVLQPRVYSLQKIDCKQRSRREPYQYECSVRAMVTFRDRKGDPLPHGERIFARWDPDRGSWRWD
jgi:hypothetical protein